MTFEVKSRDGNITALRGRFGDFIFRTFKNGKIYATYSPVRPRSNIGPISVHLREQIKELNLEIVGENENR